jgi:SAP domain-containing protein
MGLACPNCNGMGTVDGADCPVCVGGGTVEREPIEVTPEFKPAVSSSAELPPSTATPSGNTVAAVSGQGAAVIPEGVTNPAAPEAVEVSDNVLADNITAAPDQGGAVVVNEAKATAAGASAGGYEEQTVADLQDELRNRDLAVSGTKDELIARLEEDDQAKANV